MDYIKFKRKAKRNWEKFKRYMSIQISRIF